MAREYVDTRFELALIGFQARSRGIQHEDTDFCGRFVSRDAILTRYFSIHYSGAPDI